VSNAPVCNAFGTTALAALIPLIAAGL